VTYLEAIILGAVQGVFMFVPVSSTAHLVIVQHALIRGGSDLPPPESPEMILFDLVVHVGTLVSIAVVFHRSLWRLSLSAAGDANAWLMRASGGRLGMHLRLVLLGVLTVAVTGVLGLTFKSLFERVFGAPEMIVFTLATTGVLLWWTDLLKPRQHGLRGLGLGTAAVIGVAQALALIPGLSRSGLTIVAGLFCGLKRRWAAEFSFLVAIPTILAAALVQGLEVGAGAGLGNVGLGPLAVGFIVAAATGTVALKLVLKLLYRAQLKVFSIYLWLLALVVGHGYLDELL
jgi:undecaprenyl-diphosphatase